MSIDLIVGILAALAAFWGFRRGLILAVFSFVAMVLGVLLAFKFSSLVAAWLGERTSVSDRWLPILAFIIILTCVTLLIRMGAKALERMVELVQLGLINRLAGSVLYLILLFGLASMLYQVAFWAGLISTEMASSSWFAQYIQPPFMDGLQKLSQWLPGFREMFIGLEKFFKS